MRPAALVVATLLACSNEYVIVPADDASESQNTTGEVEPLGSTSHAILLPYDHDSTDEADSSTEEQPESCHDELDEFTSCADVCALEDRDCLGFRVATGSCPGEDEPLYDAGAWCGPTGWCCDLNPFVAWTWSRLHLRCVCA
jgi:hypothetical protein